ncbi:MAG: acetyl-CoA hydrolase/transferase family protein [Burkholderiaceae bacterium]
MNTAIVDWSRWLHADDHIVCSHMTAEPSGLIRSLAASPVEHACTIDLGVPFTLAPQQLGPQYRLETMGGMGTARQIAKTHPLLINRTGYRDAVSAYSRGDRVADVVLVSLARRPDGTLCLGASHGAARDAAARARVIIAEVNRAAPAICDAPWPAALAPTVICETDYPLPHAPAMPPGSLELNIAQRLADLISDGACLEVGIGAMPSAVLAALSGHRRLGLHSGMFTDAMLALIRAGAVDHSNKPSGSRHACIGGAYGLDDLYAFVADEPSVRLAHTDVTHGPQVLAAMPMFTAINSALEVDLLGQANAETAGVPDGSRRQVGGIGGLVDFANGGLASPEGHSVIALTSRTRNDASGLSRIVPKLDHEVTLSEAQADVVVTEHGLANLRGLSRAERIRQMIRIAHPDHRDWLSQQSRALKLAG